MVLDLVTCYMGRRMIDRFWFALGVFLGFVIDVSFTSYFSSHRDHMYLVKPGCTHYLFFLITTNINAWDFTRLKNHQR